VLGDTEWERFDNAVGKLLSVPKEAFVKAEGKSKRERDKKRVVKKPADRAVTARPVRPLPV
jgi:hypothetical protein